jgi:hypothetical protein
MVARQVESTRMHLIPSKRDSLDAVVMLGNLYDFDDTIGMMIGGLSRDVVGREPVARPVTNGEVARYFSRRGLVIPGVRRYRSDQLLTSASAWRARVIDEV